MARKTKEETQETYDRILRAATDVFYNKGVNGTRLEDVAEAAGMTRGAVYWHFKNKLDLFSALHSRTHQGFMAQLRQKEENGESSPLARLRSLSIDILSDFKTNEERRKTISIFLLQTDYSGDMAPFLQEQLRRKEECMGVIAPLFHEAINRGELPEDSDCEILSWALFSYSCGLMLEDLLDPGRIDLDEKAAALIDIFFKGIKAG